NFWPAQAPSKGPNGPCGPCSEIYFDLEGGPLPAHDGLSELPRRFVEIGNCVFTQFDRQSDGSLPALPQRNIDVGLGLERITAVLQGKRSNFETDLFTPYVDFVAARAGKPYGATPHDDIHLRRIADHARAVTFCISDGALPANEGRGYVVRKILRRACRDGYELGLSEPFLAEVCGIVCDTMRGAYPALEDSRKQVQALVLQEERAFRAIYTRGIDRFEQWFATLEAPSAYPKVEVEERGALALPPNSGAVAFELHDTFGFPVDITRALLLDRDFALDEAGFEAAMEQQRDRARKGSALSGDVFADNALTRLKARKVVGTRFIGYDQLEGRASIVGIVSTQQGLESDVNEVHAAVATPSVSDSPMEAVSLEVIVDVTPFYAESGGQVGDRGTIEGPQGSGRVVDCKKREDYWFHVVEVTAGRLSVGDPVTLRVDSEARRATERNHTATHLLHAALKRVVGEHVGQAGSLVAPERLRFDFTHGERLGPAVLRRLEDEVTAQVLAAFELAPCEMRLDEARRSGFVAMFGEKYGDVVRTLAIGDYSRELCGGTHVANTGNIGAFRIVSEASVAAGVRRIEAITGFDALHAAQDERDVLDRVARDLKAKPEEVPARIDALRQELRRLEKEVEEARREKGKDATAALEAAVEVHGPHASLVAKLEGADHNALLDSLDRLRRKQDS
ncbi:MAG TPA: alanine--tRNA ligase, partial [Planctomycetota bacterium]|nr:alanine--tRNA ligase [Planctomycetota bacterium]